MASVITMAAEKKKLKLSKRKQALAPNHWTSRPAMAGLMICDPCTACDISPLTASNPAAGASARTATDCAGTKKLDTVLSPRKMKYMALRSRTSRSEEHTSELQSLR